MAKPLKTTAKVVGIVGNLNWGLVGVGGFLGQNWNVVNKVLGSMPVVENVVYVAVGLAGVYAIYDMMK